MTAGQDFERRLAADLRRELDPIGGPHPSWAVSPAAARVADRRGGIRWPGRLLAIAAVLALAGGVAAVVGLRHDGVAGCPTLADYAAASAIPMAPQGQAPGVSFPPVAPTATMTTGLLQPGDWAVIANGDGPGLQMRVRDVRDCGRLPDVRSFYSDGSIYLATVDARVLRDDTGLSWLGVQGLLEGAVGERPGGLYVGGSRDGVPGVDDRSKLDVSEGFAVSSALLLDVPNTDKLITVDHPTENTMTLPGLEPTQLGWPRVRWVIRDGDPSGGGLEPEPFVSPGPTATTGEVRLEEDVTFDTSAGLGVLRLRGLDTVAAYPGLVPPPGDVYIEVLVTLRDRGRAETRWNDWHAIGPGGQELTIVHDTYGSDQTQGVPEGILNEVPGDAGWVVVEAPERGPIRLEYREYGSTDAVFWLQLRD